LIAYRNNRLLNTLRRILEIEYGDGSDLSELVQFYSTGADILTAPKEMWFLQG